jgi:V/A-type H+-transporting ATPase subunit E
MQNKIQELTEKIYKEGISKGNAEAEAIISKAKKEAESILAEAKKESEAILHEANKKAGELKSNTESELKLSVRQAINSLKQQVVDLISNQIISQTVDNALQDKDFIKKILETIIKNWFASSEKPAELTLLLPEKDAAGVEQYFAQTAKELLNKGLVIKPDAEMKTGFQIIPKDGSYKMSFTDSDFENFFREFLRPRLMKLLFASE